MRKCVNCLKEFHDSEVGDLIIGNRGEETYPCPHCGDNTLAIGKPVEPVPMDLNRDGKVDKKDVSLAAKVLSKVGSKKRKKKGGRR